jgi:hypothetical protein
MKSGVSLITMVAHTRLHGKEIVMRRLITTALILMVLPLSVVAQRNVESEESNVIDTLDQSPEGLLMYNYVYHTPQIAGVSEFNGRGYVGPAYNPVGVPPNGVTSLLSKRARGAIGRVTGVQIPEVKEVEFWPVGIQHKRYDIALGKVYPSVQAEQSASRTAFHNAPSPYWSMTTGPKISEEKAGAWEDELMLQDEANTNVIADAIDTSTLKIVCAGPIGLHNTDKYTNTMSRKAYLIEQKALGYNAVLFEWLTGATTAPALRDLMEWANGEFDTIILAPVPSAFAKHIMPTVADMDTTLDALMDQADAVLLGWGFTIDTVLMGDEGSKGFCKRFFRVVERRAAAKGTPVWGSLHTRYHGGDRKYQYTPENHTAYVCGNIVPQGMTMSTEDINAKVAAHGVPSGKPIIFGPFHLGNIDKNVARFNRRGFGAIKMEIR